MKNIIDVVIIVGFLIVDFLFFHDMFKTGEIITTAQYAMGLLSVLVIARSVHSLIRE